MFCTSLTVAENAMNKGLLQLITGLHWKSPLEILRHRAGIDFINQLIKKIYGHKKLWKCPKPVCIENLLGRFLGHRAGIDFINQLIKKIYGHKKL